MSQSNRDSSQNNDNRPSASELIGASKEQLKRQGKRRMKNSRKKQSDAGPRYEESGSWFYQGFLSTASIIFFVLGLLALSIWGIERLNQPGEPELVSASAPEIVSIVNARKVTFSTTTPVSRLRTSLPEGQNFSQSFGVRLVDNREVILNSGDILSALGSELGLRVHLNDEFMYGSYQKDADTGHFLLFSVRDYRSTYGTLLQRENEIGETLSPLGFSPAEEFTDEIIANQDVRVGGGEAGGGQLYYSFPRQNRLVITTNETTLRAVFEKLRRSN